MHPAFSPTRSQSQYKIKPFGSLRFCIFWQTTTQLSETTLYHDLKGKELSSYNGILTEKGDNWTVVVFRCQRQHWTDILSDLMSELDKQGLAFIPHYTLRGFEASTSSLIVSFRILRKEEHEKAVKDLIDKALKGYDYEIDPDKGSAFSEQHKWFRHGQVEPDWNKEKCQALSKISRVVLEIINSDTGFEQRYQWLHLFANMSVIFQIEERCSAPEIFPRECIMTH
jgi:hypothetical protein